MIFDIHTHIGETKFANNPWTGETILKIMDQNGIDRALLLPTASLGRYMSGEKMAEEVNKAPRRLVGFILVNPNDGKKAVDELERAVTKFGAKGLKIHPTHMAMPADDERVYPLMEKAQELKIPVMFHSGEAPYATPWQIGLVALDFPKVTVIMEHMGVDGLSFVNGAIKMAKRAPNLILGTTGVKYDAPITKAVQAIGSDRVVFGSESPINNPKVEIVKVQVAKISDADREKIFWKNSMRILGLKED